MPSLSALDLTGCACTPECILETWPPHHCRQEAAHRWCTVHRSLYRNFTQTFIVSCGTEDEDRVQDTAHLADPSDMQAYAHQVLSARCQLYHPYATSDTRRHDILPSDPAPPSKVYPRASSLKYRMLLWCFDHIKNQYTGAWLQKF